MTSNQEFVDVTANRAGLQRSTDKEGERTIRVQIEAGRRDAIHDNPDKQIRLLDLQGKCVAIGEKVNVVDEGEKIVLCLRVVETPEDKFQEEPTGPIVVISDKRSNSRISLVRKPAVYEEQLHAAAVFLFAIDPETPFESAENLREAAVKWGLPPHKAEEILVDVWHHTRPKLPLGVPGVARPVDKTSGSKYSSYADYVTHEIEVTQQIYTIGDPGSYLEDGEGKMFLIKERLPTSQKPMLALKEVSNNPHDIPQLKPSKK